MEIQQHDGVVVDVAGLRQGFAKLLREGEVLQGRGRCQRLGCGCPPSPPLYIGPMGGPALGDGISKGGRRPGGGLPPKPGGGAPTPRVSNPRHRGGKGAHQPT